MTICLSLALSGLTATQGTQAIYTSATNYVNQHFGGIDGHQVSVMLANDSGNATTAVQNINHFVALHKSNPNNCVAEVGMDYDPSIQPAMVAVTNKNKMITVLDSSVDDYSNAAKYPYLFPINPSDSTVGTAVGKYMASRNWTKWAVLTDGIPQESEEINDDLAGAKAAGSNPTIVKTATVSPGSTNVQTALLELKQANPDVVLVMIGLGYGAVWNTMKTMGWSPNIVGDLAAFYFEYDAMGSLASNAYSPAWWGSIPNYPTLPANILNYMNIIKPLNPPNYPGLLISANVGLDKVLMVKYAVEKYHSVNSDAMKRGLETLNDTPIFWQGNRLTESSSTHTGIVGPYSAGAMNMGHLGPLSLFQYAEANGSPLASPSDIASLKSTTPVWPASASSTPPTS
jgi:ABC-type branched-subunit amino acid transport system substrate-binding protein